jgi:hydroxypyruvate isomerase
MLKFCANLSLLFTEVALAERFQAAKQAGFAAVEIQFPYSLPAAQIAEILARQQLKLVLFNVDADDLLQGGEGLACVPEKKQQFKQALQQTLEYAEQLKPEVINVLPGRCLDNLKIERYLDTFKENLQLALTAFRPLGIKTVFEAINTLDMQGFLISSGEQMLQILADINQPDLFMQYDIYHADKTGENWAMFIRQHADKIGHIQFADNPGRGEPGTGAIDFQTLFSVIENSGYQGWLGAEYKPIGSTLNSLNWYPYKVKVNV